MKAYVANHDTVFYHDVATFIEIVSREKEQWVEVRNNDHLVLVVKFALVDLARLERE